MLDCSPAGSLMASYKLVDGRGSPTCKADGMLLKAAQLSPAHAPQHSLAASASQTIYHVCWTTMAAASGTGAMELPPGLSDSLTSSLAEASQVINMPPQQQAGHKLCLFVGTGSASAHLSRSQSTTIGRQLEVLQCLATLDHVHPLVEMQMLADIGGTCTAPLRPAAHERTTGYADGAMGLLRAAAAERNSMAWRSVSALAVAPCEWARRHSLAPPLGDGFGVAYGGGAWSVPHLRVAGVPGRRMVGLSIRMDTSNPALCGSIIVTGGLGDLGVLTGAWVTQVRHPL
jgi:hypothetical protein